MPQYNLTSNEDGRRLDRVLKEWWPGVPLSARMKAIRVGAVRLDGQKVTCNTKIEAGAKLLLVPWKEAPDIKYPVNTPPKDESPRWIVYQDENILVANKAPGLLVQPDRPSGDSLITRVWSFLGVTEGTFRPAAIHRLDRNTSGAVVIALNAPTLRRFTELLRERELKKIYLALVLGKTPKAAEINVPLTKITGENKTIIDAGGLASLTRYDRLGIFDIQGGEKLSLLKVELVTGRPHQIRAHLSHIGHPIAGDVKYGEAGKNFKRPMLHAWKIYLPFASDLKEITAPPCEDMAEYCAEYI